MERMKIIAVDDNAANLTTIEQELQDYYNIVTFLTGRRAIKYLLQEKVDLILLDVQIPIMDGIETLREIRTLENGATIPVIFLTAMKDKYTVIEGAKLGIVDYITKPFDATNLRERIEQAFIRLGRIVVPLEMLQASINETLIALEEKREKAVLAKLDEMTGYLTAEELHERIRHSRIKFTEGDEDACQKMLLRLQAILEKELINDEYISTTPIDLKEIHSRLLIILGDLEHFYLKKAKEKLEEFDYFELSPEIYSAVQKIQEMLEEFDDEGAEETIRQLLIRIHELDKDTR